ncbi:MAG: DNA-methyltransferase [bacterium]|jgi:DNA modification methylase
MKAIIPRSSEDMREVPDASAQLVLTSPPYWGPESEAALHAPRKAQLAEAEVQAQLREFTRSLAPVVEEVCRVLSPHGSVVWQVKDLRFGGALIPLSDWHSALLQAAGLSLLGRVGWLAARVRPEVLPGFSRAAERSKWHPLDPEYFLIFTKGQGLSPSTLPGAWEQELWEEAPRQEWVLPFWRLPRGFKRNNHPHASPAAPIRRFLKLLSDPGDLVVDPFAGGGNILREARMLGRRVIGYEIQPHWAEVAQNSLNPLP